MDLDAHHDLKLQVFRLTWQSLKGEAQALHAGAPGPVPQAPLQRFYSPHTLELVRQAIVQACREAEAGGEVTEYFSRHWLQRFAPRPI